MKEQDAAVGGHPHAEGEHPGEGWVLEQVRVEKVGEQPEEQHPCGDQSRVEPAGQVGEGEGDPARRPP